MPTVQDDDLERPWAGAASLAVAWTEQRCVEEGADAVLVTNALGHLGPGLEAFARPARHNLPEVVGETPLLLLDDVAR